VHTQEACSKSGIYTQSVAYKSSMIMMSAIHSANRYLVLTVKPIYPSSEYRTARELQMCNLLRKMKFF